jgi:hypothetical protein
MKSERSTASRIIRLRRAAGSVLKLQIRPKAEHDHVRNMDVAAALYNVLEGWAHVPPRSDIKPVEDFQRIFGAGNGNAGIGQLDYFGDATIVIGTAGRKSDHIVRTQRERSGKKRLGCERSALWIPTNTIPDFSGLVCACIVG